MITITTDQALERWDTLPDSLREALYSEPNSDFLWRTCQDENVPDEKIYEIAKVAGYVMMGFLHPEDVALEIVDRLALDRKTASDIQEALNKRVFAPLQADLSKVYNPLSKFEGGSKILQNAGPNSQSPKMVFDMVSGGGPKPAQVPASPKPIAPAAPKPVAPSSSVVVAPTVSQKPISAVLSSITPSTPTTKIPSPSEGKFGSPSLSQAGWSKTIVSPTQSPFSSQAKPSASPSEPAPIILHEDAKFTSSEKTADFHLARPGGSAEVSLEGVKTQQTVKPAVLELGSLTNAPAKPEPSAPKFTHYTQFQISTQPIDRHVTEITASAPKTATPPISVATPITAPATAKPISSPTVPVSVRIPTMAPAMKPPTSTSAPAQLPSQPTAAPKPPLPPRPPTPTPIIAVAPSKPIPPAPPTSPAKVMKVNYP